MAYAQLPVTIANAVVAAPGTSVAPSVPIPDNCISITVINTSLLLGGLVGIAVPGFALTAGTTAAPIPAGGSMVFPLGDLQSRGIMDEVQLAGSGFVYDAVGGAVTFVIVYQNKLGA